jgi:hypothetical protein
MMDMIMDAKTYMDAPPELFSDVAHEFTRDKSLQFVRLYHRTKDNGCDWLPVLCRDPVIDLEQETKNANQEGWNYIATLTDHGCGHA